VGATGNAVWRGKPHWVGGQPRTRREKQLRPCESFPARAGVGDLQNAVQDAAVSARRVEIVPNGSFGGVMGMWMLLLRHPYVDNLTERSTI